MTAATFVDASSSAPQCTNIGRFQYTGQMWLSEIGAYYYKARVYLPHLGIFAQTDPIDPEDSPNRYQYALNDPVNHSDPMGLSTKPVLPLTCDVSGLNDS